MVYSQAVPSLRKKRAEEKFIIAAGELQNAIPEKTCDRLGEISFPNLDGVCDVETRASALGDALERLIQARGERANDKKKVGDMMMKWFKTSYPFAKLFLTVVKEGSSVKFPQMLLS